ncbi:MAG: tetratricopeptide repeat protein [Planctomycetales bacterium]|nr:tetratricopeptide repeat protein [Planctomycetales bacterium]
MSSHAAKIARADEYFSADRFADAERILYDIVAKRPKQWDAWFRLAAVCLKLGKIDHAESSARKAVEINPDLGVVHGRLAVVLRAAGKLDEAICSYGRALESSPRDATCWFNLGNALREKGESERASRAYQSALAIRPDFIRAHQNLGNLLADNDAPHAAIQHFDAALKLAPQSYAIWIDRGNALKRLRLRDEAVECYEKALECEPRSVAALNNLGNERRDMHRFDESLELLQRALEIDPDHPQSHNNLGITLARVGRFEEAVHHYQRALDLRPDYANAHYNWGDVCRELGRLQAARQMYRKALEVDPDHAEAHFHLAQDALQQGDFATGWELYEWRWRTREARGTERSFDIPAWQGEPLEGKTILLHAEQGWGDTLQFIRFASLLQSRGARVVFECPARLMTLLSRTPGVDEWIKSEETPPSTCDFQSALMSVPGRLAVDNGSIPADVPYVFADPELERRWSDVLSAGGGFKVGVAWQGSVTNLRDRTRSMPLRHFKPLAQDPRVRLLSLQKGPGEKQLADADFPIENLAAKLDNGPDGFVDTAAVMRNLDLVITSDTSIAHLAGSLGVPVWVALNDVPEWRWQLERADSPWYPTMQLFRQQVRGDWEGLFAEIADALSQRLTTWAGA